jgi:hypothetical protein
VTGAALNCPRCSSAMTSQALEGHHGQPITIDLCLVCQSFWFDAHESLRLSPASTLKLFRIVGDEVAVARPAVSNTPACPRCRTPLRLTRDIQRSTRFEYFNCPRGHGRLTTFFNFLREKNFIRPLSAAQIAELRQNLQTVNCSNCGAPVNVVAGAACTHCSSPLSMLDMEQAGRLVDELRAADRTGAGLDPAMPLELERSRREVHAAFDRFEREPSWFETGGPTDLVGAGLRFVGRWLKG